MEGGDVLGDGGMVNAIETVGEVERCCVSVDPTIASDNRFVEKECRGLDTTRRSKTELARWGHN